jgi:hypothetical protein
LNATGAPSGLGNGDVLITLTARANVTSTCSNQGGNEAPGQNPAPITVSGSEATSAVRTGATTSGHHSAHRVVHVLAGDERRQRARVDGQLHQLMT